jgi:hypothetical protein
VIVVAFVPFFFVSHFAQNRNRKSNPQQRKEERKEIAANIPEKIFVLYLYGFWIILKAKGEGDGGLDFCCLLLLRTSEALHFALRVLEQLTIDKSSWDCDI